MNIFVLDWNPKLCAQYHNDKHVVKMILETAQLLCGAHWATGGEAPYKLSHKNHPCSVWVREDLQNYIWLVDLGFNLCQEYTYRYGKRHKTQDIIEWCAYHRPKIKDLEFTPPALAMPEEFKVYGDTIQSYRNYYIGDKKGFCVWKGRNTPEWFQL